ncbi:MAG TPA: PBECR2 nuclease fold domain-containing protein [Aliidongia sp.]|uniref:PBECR2 nuclease fold domain-containing protein n=1 Tax=Aliidongia sp. TaxID=1914230 RepID=UPI002DDD826A|nr:PBECR2 nuclease fold domain-containing protein [Aliidongia sp.]HEV2678782.1 PBECR2 nuclease fold domain-containing protein [Aliidongia sp.]
MANDADAGDDYAALPFKEAQDHLRAKINLPSAKWADVLHGAHTQAFTVAGATKEGMLVDFHAAIQKAIDDGTTLADFRQDFDGIVQKYGWSYNGGRAWRTRLIYETNLTTAYSVGRYQQMTDPDVLRVRPFWMYRHSDAVKHPRPEHVAWNGLVLRYDDPWWKTHYPPNGWYCHCTVEPMSLRELRALGKSGPDQAPASDDSLVTLNTTSGPLQISVPKGVDPGWGYNPGEAAHGRPPDSPMQAWEDGQKKWEPLPPFDRQDPARTARLPVDEPTAKLGPTTASSAEMIAAVKRAIGADSASIPLPDGSTVQVDATDLGAHLALDRGPFIPFLPEMMSNPAEIWLAFERNLVDGRVVLRKRVLKVIHTGKQRGLVLVIQSVAGRLEAWTFFRSNDPKYIERLRIGRLIWSRNVE